MKVIRLLFLILVMLLLIWLYIVNIITHSEYVFVYSESKYYRAFQYILQGLWAIVTYFGWMPLIGIGIGLSYMLFPTGFKNDRNKLVDRRLSEAEVNSIINSFKKYGKGKN